MFPRWFKSVIPFDLRLEQEHIPSIESMKENVRKLVHTPITASQRESIGFSSVLGYHDPKKDHLVYVVEHYWFLSTTFEEKRLNKTRYNRLVAEEKRKAAEKAQLLVKDLEKKQVREIEEQVRTQLLQDIEATESYLNIILDTKRWRIYFDETNGAHQKKAISLLQKVIPSLKFTAFEVEGIQSILSLWLENPAKFCPEELDLLDAVRLKSKDEASAGLRKQDLASQEIQSLLDHGKKVEEILVSYLGRIEFKLTANCQLRSLKMMDGLNETIERPEVPVNHADDFEPDWCAMCAEIDDVYIFLGRVIEEAEMPAKKAV